MMTFSDHETSKYNPCVLFLQMRGEIDQAQESLNIYHTMEAAVHRCRKHYQHSVDHLAKAKGKVERAKADGPLNPKLSGVSELGGEGQG